MRNTKWIFKSEEFESKEICVDKDIEQILYNRGIETKEEVEFFIDGTLEDLMNPSHLEDVDKAVERIL
ncbi:MAG: single-stranded-DNA-specific exonuclease RecJ, partial [Cetobacterium sp.]